MATATLFGLPELPNIAGLKLSTPLSTMITTTTNFEEATDDLTSDTLEEGFAEEVASPAARIRKALVTLQDVKESDCELDESADLEILRELPLARVRIDDENLIGDAPPQTCKSKSLLKQ